MDQTVMAGIGNIYSDEMLWWAGIHPETKTYDISYVKLKLLYGAMKSLLKKGIVLGGDSMSDYRNIFGERGHFQEKHSAYQKKGERCSKRGCGGIIVRKMVGGRSAHFCSTHQKFKVNYRIPATGLAVKNPKEGNAGGYRNIKRLLPDVVWLTISGKLPFHGDFRNLVA